MQIQQLVYMWIERIIMDLKEREYEDMDWIYLSQNKIRCVIMDNEHWSPQKTNNFFRRWINISILRIILVLVVS
jgi:hypothetical protein